MFISLDLETTGFDATKDKIIEFGAVKFDLGGQKETLKFFVNPGITLPQIISHITNIQDSDLKDAVPFSEKLIEVQNFIGNLPIIGHNIQFDIGFLQNNGVEIKNPTYDTQELSSILLPNMPSYSLEILSEKLQLKHHEKHRALDDSIAAMELFLKLLKEFENLEPELLERMKILSQRSNWPLKDLLATIKSNSENRKTASEKSKNIQKISPQSQGTETFVKILDKPESALFELRPPYDNLIKFLCDKAPANTHISVPYYLFRKIHSEIPDTVAKLDVAQNYLSTERLEEFSKKEFFENHEITSLLKYLNWSHQTKTGLLSEVALFHDERNTLKKVNIDENIDNPKEEYFFKKALEKEENSPALCTHQYLIENSQENNQLIIIDFENFLSSLHYHHSIFLKLEPIIALLKAIQESCPPTGDNSTISTLINKITILFGLFGIIFEKFNDQNMFTARSVVNDTILQTKEWLDATQSLANIIEISQELGAIKNSKNIGYLKQWKEILKNFHAVLSKPEISQNLVWLEKDPKANLVIRKSPFSLKEDLNKIFEKSINYKIIEECVDLEDDCKFTKSLGNFETSLPIEKLDQKIENLEIYITKDTDGSDPNKIPNFIEKYYRNNSQNIAMVFSAKKDLEFFTLKLSQKDLPLVPQLAGSLGKIQERFLTEKKSLMPPILLVTPHIWENFEHYESIDTLLIFKIPFEPPSDAKLIALSQNYADPFNELQIPLAVTETKKIIHRLKQASPNLKKVILLDHRLSSRGYGKIFIKNLTQLAPTNSVKLHTLLK